MKAEYECWKCPEWHETEFHLSSASFCKQRVTIWRFQIVIPEMRWLDKWWWQQTYRDWKFRLTHWQCTECRKWYRKNTMWKVSHQEIWCQECM